MKRLLTIALVLCLTLSLGSMSVTQAEDFAPATLNIWLGGPGGQPDADMVFAEFNKQLPEYIPNTTADFQIIRFEEYGEKWSKAMAAGEKIDVAWFGWVMDLNMEISMGALQPLDELIDQYAPDLKAELGESVLNAHRINGSIYAVPCWQGLAGSARADIMLKGDVLDAMENKNYIAEFDDVLAQIRETDDLFTRYQMFYDKFEEYLQSAKDTGTLGLGYFDLGNITFMHDMETLYNNGTTVTGTIYVNKGDEDFVLQSDVIDDSDAFNLKLYQYSRLYDYWQKGFFRDDYRTCDMDVNFGGGDPSLSWVADITGSYNRIIMGREAAEARLSANCGFDVKVVSSGDSTTLGKGYATCTVIPYTAEYPDRGMMYINLMNSSKGKDLYHTLVYGIEGTHYTINENGRIVLAGGDGGPDSTWAYGQNPWVVGTIMNSYLKVGDLEGQLERQLEYDKTAVILPLYDFEFDPTDVEMEITNCRAIMDEYKYLYTYEDYEARLRERNAKLMAAGYGDIMEALRTQLDAFLAENDVSWPEY